MNNYVKIELAIIVIIMLIRGYFNINTAEAKGNIFLDAEKQFISEMGTHKYRATWKNKCTYRPSAIAYAFSWAESGLGTSNKGSKSNNWTSLHIGGIYHYKWTGKSTKGFISGEVVRYYKTPQDGLVDFMYLWKYGYGCKIDLRHIYTYVNGWKYDNYRVRLNKAKRYLKFVQEKILEFNQK